MGIEKVISSSLTGILPINKGGTGGSDTETARINLGVAPAENGFIDRTESTLSFVEGTRTFTIAPTGSDFSYYSNTVKYTKSTSESIVISDVEGLHYIYYNDDTLEETTTFSIDLIINFSLVAVIYWNATDNSVVLFGDERHGNVMDSATHAYNHVTFGSRYEEGLALSDLIVDGDGNLDTHAQVGVTGGAIWDEDIKHDIVNGSPQTLSPTAQIPLFYRTGSTGNWRKLVATNFPVTTTGTGRIAWNEDTGTTWQLTEADNNSYVLTHLFATGDVLNPIIGIIGQNNYATKSEAQNGASNEIYNLSYGQLDTLTPEFVPIASLIFETNNVNANAVKSSIISTESGSDYIDWRISRLAVGSNGVNNTLWGDIGGTLSNQTDLQDALDLKANNINTIYSTDVTLSSPTLKNYYVLKNTTTVTLPEGTSGDWIGFADHDGSFGTTNVTINCSGSDTFSTSDTSIILNTNFANVILGFANGKWSFLSAEDFTKSTNQYPTSFLITCSPANVDISPNTEVITFRSPYDFELTDIRASVATAPVGSNIIVDVNLNGVSILSTKLTIDAGEETSVTATTPVVISNSSILDNDKLTIDIDQVGSTTPGQQLVLTFIGIKTN